MATRPLPAVQALQHAPGRVLHRDDLAALIGSSSAVHRIARSGWLQAIMPGWYRRPGDDAPWQLVHLALAHSRRRGHPALVSGAEMLRLAGCELPAPARPLVLIPHGIRHRPTDGLYHVLQRRRLEQLGIEHHRGLATVAASVALADFAAQDIADPDLRVRMYEVRNSLRLSPARLVKGWLGMRHPGASRLLRMADAGDLEHESPAERDTFRVFRAFPPTPDCQVQLARNIRVDFAYLFAGLVIEYLGEQAHAGTVDRDSARTSTLRGLGCDVLTVTKSMMRHPRDLADHIHQTRRRREALVMSGQLSRIPVPAQPSRLTPLRTMGPLH